MWCYFGFKEQGGDNNFVYCVLCKTKLKYCRNTTNLLSHFKSQHALEYTRSELLKIKPSLLPSKLSGVIGSTLGPGRRKLRWDPSQITLSNSLVSQTKLPPTSKRAKDLTSAIGYYLAKDMQALNTVQGTGFQHTLSIFEPDYQIPHRKTFTDHVLPALLTWLKEGTVMPAVATTEYFAIATDCWMSWANDFIHWCDNSFAHSWLGAKAFCNKERETASMTHRRKSRRIPYWLL